MSSVAGTSANGSLGASGVGSYGFTVIVSPDCFAASSKFLEMSSGEMSLIVGTTISVSAVPPAMSAP